MLYGANVWDPILILSQIVSIQALFYLGLGFIECIFLGGHLSVAHILGHTLISFHTYTGMMLVLSNIVNAALGAVMLLWIVERAKKCLDFASSCLFIHFVCCCFYSGFPYSLGWWVSNTISLLIMWLVGEWLCVRREMADIPIGSIRPPRTGGGMPSSSETSSLQMSTLSGGQV